jgi:5-methylcytosine-specific restriction protein A
MSWSTSDRYERLPSNWEYLKHEVMVRDGGRCQIRWDDGCEGEATDVDHVDPGDDHRLENLQAGCGHCHARKSAREGNNAKAKLRRMRKRPTGRHPGLR